MMQFNPYKTQQREMPNVSASDMLALSNQQNQLLGDVSGLLKERGNVERGDAVTKLIASGQLDNMSNADQQRALLPFTSKGVDSNSQVGIKALLGASASGESSKTAFNNELLKHQRKVELDKNLMQGRANVAQAGNKSAQLIAGKGNESAQLIASGKNKSTESIARNKLLSQEGISENEIAAANSRAGAELFQQEQLSGKNILADAEAKEKEHQYNIELETIKSNSKSKNPMDKAFATQTMNKITSDPQFVKTKTDKIVSKLDANNWFFDAKLDSKAQSAVTGVIQEMINTPAGRQALVLGDEESVYSEVMSILKSKGLTLDESALGKISIIKGK